MTEIWGFWCSVGDTRPSPFSNRPNSLFSGQSHLSPSIKPHASSGPSSGSGSGSGAGSGTTNPRSSLLNGYHHPVSTSRGTYADSPPQSPVERERERGGSSERSTGNGNGNGHTLPPLHVPAERSHTHGSSGEYRQLPSLGSQHRNGLDQIGRSSSGISLPPIGAALTPRGTMLLPSRSRDRPGPVPFKDPRASELPSTSTSTSKRDVTPHSISGIERAGSVRRDRTREATRPDSPPPVGSCPGDGRCNGTGGKMGCEGCPTYNNSSSKVVLDGQQSQQQQQVQTGCAGTARRQQEQAERERYAMTGGGASPGGGVEPGFNPLIAASHAQNGTGKSVARSPGSKSARYTDEEGQW